MREPLRRATEAWAARFTQVPGSVIRQMAEADAHIYTYDSDSFRLVASPRIKCSWCSSTYEGDLSLADLTAAADRAQGVPCEYCRWDDPWILGEPEYAFPFPWTTLFAPLHRLDIEWFEEHKDEVATLGFFVFKSVNYGILLGIDAGGFDFYEAYWRPLYELRGLRWHEVGSRAMTPNVAGRGGAPESRE